MSSSLHLQQRLACLFRLTWIFFVMACRWLYSCCFVGCCPPDLFNIARSILVWLPSSFFSIRLVILHAVHPCSSIDTTTAWKKCSFSKTIIFTKEYNKLLEIISLSENKWLPFNRNNYWNLVRIYMINEYLILYKSKKTLLRNNYTNN